MTPYLVLAAGTVFLMAAASTTQFVILTFRNPMRRGVLRTDAMAIFAVLMLVVLYGLAVGAQVYGLLGVGVGSVACGIVTVAVFAGTLWINDKLFHLRERLYRADNGMSPFAPLGDAAPHAARPTGA